MVAEVDAPRSFQRRKKTDSRTSLGQLCAVLKTEFNEALNNARKRVRSQSRLAQAKGVLKEAGVDDSDDVRERLVRWLSKRIERRSRVATSV